MNQNGFAHLLFLVTVICLLIFGIVAWFALSSNISTPNVSAPTTTQNSPISNNLPVSSDSADENTYSNPFNETPSDSNPFDSIK